MVDVSQKADTERVAVAEGFIAMRPETLELITSGAAAEGRRACVRPRGGGDGSEEDERVLFLCAIRLSSRRRKCHANRCAKASVRMG